MDNFFYLKITAVLLPMLWLGVQSWYAETYWNDKYGSKGIAYMQADRENGLWSNDGSLKNNYLPASILFSSSQCSGCICDVSKQIVTNCGGTVTIVSQTFSNISSETFAVGTTSITILNCPSFKLIVERTFENLTNLRTLVIHDTGITTVPDVSRTSIEFLNLAYNQIIMTTSNYDGWKLPSTITHLAMAGNQMYWIPSGWISGPSLRIVSFSYNQLTQLSHLVFGNVSSLVYLGLDGNKMTKLSKKSLEPLVSASKFVHLNISNNLLTFIEPGTFAQLPGLKILEVHQNSISAIPVNTFSDIPSLLHLDLNNNRLATLTSNSFQNLQNLTEFRLHSQKTAMTSIAFDAWSNIGNELYLLFVSSNNLRTFPHQVMSEGYYPKLNTIYADNNLISDVVEYGEEAFPPSQRSIYEKKKALFNPFSTYPALQTLYLSNNRITHIRATDYCNLTSIINLYLSVNSIDDSNIDPEAFACIPTLRYLYLDNNRLQYVPTAMKTSTSLPSIVLLYLPGNQMTFVDEGDFSRLTTLNALYLSSNKILAIENGAFPLQLVTLSLSGNDFHFLHKHPFSNLTKLNYLELSSNEIDYLPPDAFENCTSLQSIYLNSNRIPQILKRHFENCPLTGAVGLQNNEIGWIEDGTFDHITSMSWLDLSYNQLYTLPNGGDFNALSLSFLSLHYNRLMELPTGVFRDLSMSLDINLQQNNIATIRSGAFRSVTAMNTILTNNPIRQLEKYAFNSSRFQNLYMGNHLITTLSSYSFNSLTISASLFLNNGPLSVIEKEAFSNVYIGSMYLNNNQLTTISQPMFGSGSTVQGYLYLQNNGLRTVSVDAFANLTVYYIDISSNSLTTYPLALNVPSLTEIYIQANQIAGIPDGAFSTQTGLRSLRLTNNRITQLQSGLFNSLTSLIYLYLDSNLIDTLAPRLFDNLVSLQYLTLDNNRITHLDVLGPLTNLRTLYLSNNRIETFGLNAFSSLRNIVTLDLSRNSIACQCETMNTIDAVAKSITSGECTYPTAAAEIYFGKLPSGSATVHYLQITNHTLLQCSAENLTVTAVSDHKLRLTWDQPQALVFNGSAASDVFVGPWTYLPTCVSSTATVLTGNVTDNSNTSSFTFVFDAVDGVIGGATYQCSVQLKVQGYTSAKSVPVTVTTPKSTSNTSIGISDLELKITYYDFSSVHPDFDGTGLSVSMPTYIPSPYGAWLAISKSPTFDTFSDWYRNVPGTNYVKESTIVLAAQTGTIKRYWSSAFFPMDDQGYKAQYQADCSGTFHNFGFTSAMRGAFRFLGTEKVTVGGGDALWLYINKILVAEIIPTSSSTVPCYKMNLSPAANTGGGTITPEKGTVSGGVCTGTSLLSSAAVSLKLEVGLVYHFDIFHAETSLCTSAFFFEVEDADFVEISSSNSSSDGGSANSSMSSSSTNSSMSSSSTNSSSSANSSSSSTYSESPIDYSVTVKEDLDVNTTLETIVLTDIFSVGPTFAVTIISGNEARHFTLKADTPPNHAAAVSTPWIPTYTTVPGTNVSFVACSSASVINPEPNNTAKESFSMTTTTALLTLATKLDYEAAKFYYLVLMVVDSGVTPVLTGTIAVRIKVTDVNDNCPELNGTSFTFTPIPVLTSDPLTTLRVSDIDSGSNAEYYFIVSNVTEDPERDYNSSLDLNKQIYTNSTTLTFTVVVIDNGNPPMGTSASFSVTIDNSCLVDVEFGNIDYSFIADNTTGGVYIRIPKYWVYLFQCSDYTGLTSGIVRDELLSASSSFSAISGPERGRLNYTADSYSGTTGGWVAGIVDQNQYFQINMEDPYKYTKVHIQGREDANEWVTSFKVFYSNNGTIFTLYVNGTGESIFLANTDSNSVVTIDLDPPVLAQYIRINPWTWHGSNISLRLEFSGCTQAKQLFYDTSCVRCYTTYYCEGDGSMKPCGRCDPPQENSTCGRSPTEHSFGAASKCSPCPEGWRCKNGNASICEDNHYITCNDTYCPGSCLPCESGYACRDGKRYMCGIGTYSTGNEEFCLTCPPGTYQNEIGQSSCKNCLAGYYSSEKKDRCEPCAEDTYSTGGTACIDCISVSDCPCMAGNKCFPGTVCYNTGSGGHGCGDCPSGYIGNGVNCVDIDECYLSGFSPCWNGSACINTVPGYQCLACPEGYTGTYEDALAQNVTRRVFFLGNDVLAPIQVQVCNDIDECATNNGGCNINMNCVNTIGSYYCSYCKEGYMGNAVVGCYLADFCISGAHDCKVGSKCVYIAPGVFTCECMDGYAGDGKVCGVDTDQDGFPDLALTCTDKRCARDNCVSVPNSGQEDNDKDNLGDSCDDDDDNDGIKDTSDNCPFVSNFNQADSDGDGIGNVCDNCPSVSNSDQLDTDGDGVGNVCDSDKDGDGIADITDKCPLVSNSGQADRDGDSVGDSCDNCVSVSNALQTDTDQNMVGDACDTVGGLYKDKDGDSILNFLDNCQEVANADQSDIDMDGVGDLCDKDQDGDGVTNVIDNCPFRSNADQKDSNNDGIGDACVSDSDNDGVQDTVDTCPHNPSISTTSFSKYFTVNLDPTLSTSDSPVWKVVSNGTEVQQTEATEMPTMLIGNQSYGAIEYSGTWYVSSAAAEDYIGFVFGYVNNRKFYVVMWKRTNHNFGNSTYKTGIKGIQIKVVDSNTGPGTSLSQALWHSYDTNSHVKYLWQDPDMQGWEPQTTYRWHLTHQPSIGYIRLITYRGDTQLVDSGAVYDSTITGGRLGVFQHGAFSIIWSDLKVRCLDDANKGLYFDGKNDYVLLPNVTTLKMNASFTVEVWISLDSGFTTGPYPILCTYSGKICLTIVNRVFVGRYGDANVTTTSALSADTYYAVTLKYSLEYKTLTLFVDGIKTGFTSSVPIIDWTAVTKTSDTILYLGRDSSSFFRGTMDELRIYSAPVPDDETDDDLQLPALERPILKGYANVDFKMEESAGAITLTNSGILNIDGQINGATFVVSYQSYNQFKNKYPTNK